MSIEAGNLIAGKFRLDRPLAKGGMGSVWVAFNTQLEVPVAVKFMDPLLVQAPELVARFEREAKASAQLRHPHVVQIFEHGVDRGVPFIAMELLEGEDLIARLRARGRLSLVETARILGDVCKALRKAHEMGIVHRDLKPANIFLARHDDLEVVKVLDFGIAKAMNPTTADGPTKTGALVGSPHYMAPEQARKTNKQVDHRSDLWALGVIAFRCFTGQLPFAGDDIIDVLVRVCTTTRPPTPSSIGVNLGPEVDAFFAKALAREPENRFQSAKEMAEALNRLAGIEPQMGLDRSWSDPSGQSRRASDPGALGGAPPRMRTEDPRASMPAPKVILSEPAPRPSGPPAAAPIASSPVASSPVAPWPVGAPASGPYRPPSSSSLPAQRMPTSNPPVPSSGAIPPPRASQPSGPAPVAPGVSPLRSTMRMEDPDDGAQTVPIHASASAMAVVSAAAKKAPDPTAWQPSAQRVGATTMPLTGIAPVPLPKSHAADSPTMVTVAGTDPAAVAAAISRAGDSTKAEGTLTGAGTELSPRTGRKDSPWVIIAAVVAVVIVVGVIGGVVMLGAQAGSGSEEPTTTPLWTTTSMTLKEDEKPPETTTTTMGSGTATGSGAPTATPTAVATPTAQPTAVATATPTTTPTSTATVPTKPNKMPTAKPANNYLQPADSLKEK